MPIRFRPPRDVPDLGLTPGQQARFNAWLRTAFTEIAEDMAALGQSDAPTIVAQETIDVAAGSLRRVTPPSGGMTVRVPAPTPANAGQTVRLMIEAPVGELTVVSVPGVGDDGKVFQPTINGASQATFSASGLVTLTSNGSSDWKSASEFAAESPASIAVSSGGAALDAQYLLRAANSRLPNARVADDSTEIDISYSSPGLITWFLKTASVAFSKLANLTGLSVLGRASNSAGVMAAITATAARQTLRNNDAGTALEWGNPVEAQESGVDQGDVHTLDFHQARVTVASGVAQIGPPTTIVVTESGTLNNYALPSTLRHGDTLAIVCSPSDVTLTGIAGGTPGFGFYLNVSGAAARVLAVVDESGSSTATNRISLAQDLDARNPPGATFWVSYGATRWSIADSQYVEGFNAAGTSQGFSRSVRATSTTSIIGTLSKTSDQLHLNYQRAALTGFCIASQNSNATTSAEPIITYSASANMSNERVLSNGTNTVVDLGTAGQAQIDVDNYPLSGLADQAAHTFVANITGSVAAPTASPLATLAGDYLSYNNAGGINWAGAGILDNAGGVLGTQGQILQGLDSTTITEDWAFSVDTAALRYNVNLAAAFTWTGGHSWNTAGDFDVTAAIVGLNSNSTFGVTAVGDATIQSDGDVSLTGDEVRVRSNGTGGFLTFDAATASTPGLAAEEGMYWVSDPDPLPTVPRFTDDTNVDHQLGYAFTKVQSNSSTGSLGTIALNDDTTVFRWGGGAGSASIQGFSGRLWDGRRLLVRNIDGTDGDSLTLEADSAATAADGFHGAGTGASNDASRDKVIRNRGSIMLTYDITSSRWYMEGI